MVKKAMDLAFPNMSVGDSYVRLDEFTYMVYSSQDSGGINLMIGVNLANDIDDFTVMQLNFESAMSIFTDRLDVIEFLKAVKRDSTTNEADPTQEDIDRILDKLSRLGENALTSEDKRKLGRF